MLLRKLDHHISNTPPTAPCAVLENDHALCPRRCPLALFEALFLLAGTRAPSVIRPLVAVGRVAREVEDVVHGRSQET